MPSEKGDVLELDELWSFVRAKWKECWLWVAVCRRTRQIVSYTLGDRRQESARWLRETIPEDYVRRRHPQRLLGGLWGGLFPGRTHRFCGKEEGETNHAERWFGTLRARLRRVVRRAYSFSKCVDRHADAIHLFIVNYHLTIQRQSTTI